MKRILPHYVILLFMMLMVGPGDLAARELHDTSLILLTDYPLPGSATEAIAELDTAPIVHNGHRIVFLATIRQGGFFRGYALISVDQRDRNVEVLSRTGDPTPNVDGNLDGAWLALCLNAQDQVLFEPRIDNSSDPQARDGVFVADASGLHQIVRTNDWAPAMDYRISEFYGRPYLNAAGETAFVVKLLDPNRGRALMRGTVSSSGLQEVLRAGDTAPDGELEYSILWEQCTLNESGDIAFGAFLQHPFLPANSAHAILIAGDSNVVEIAREGDETDNGSLFALSAVVLSTLNASEQISFISTLQGTLRGGLDDQAVFRGDAGSLTEIARKYDFVPGNNGRFLRFTPQLTILNDAGQVLFHAEVGGATGGQDLGLFIGDGDSVIPVARRQQAIPDGEGSFYNFSDYSMNQNGQVLFGASIDLHNGGGFEDSGGIFLYDPEDGITTVARHGDELPGAGIISDLFLAGEAFMDQGFGATGLNDRGQVVYSFFADGEAGVALWPHFEETDAAVSPAVFTQFR